MTHRFLVLIATFLTGAAGLIYEVTWHRYLANLVGGEARATAIILAVFLGGLSVGYFIFGKFSKKKERIFLLKTFAITELIIGVWALKFPIIYDFAWIYNLKHGYGDLWFDILISILLIGLPTILMGGTIPLLTQSLSKDLSDSPSFHAKVYATNTGGACLGAILAGFLIIPAYGLDLTVMFTSIVNITIGILLYISSNKIISSVTASKNIFESINESEEVEAYRFSLTTVMSIAFLAGFYSITVQTILIRVIKFSIGSSEYAFSVVVSAFILALALGAYSISKERINSASLLINQCSILITLTVLYVSVPYWPYIGHVVRSLLSTVTPNFYIFHILIFLLLILIIIVPIGAMGRTLPILFAITQSKSDLLGSIVGKIYGLNTVGCVLGAIIGGYLALYVIDLDVLLQVSLFLIYLTIIVTLPFKRYTVDRYSRKLILLAPLFLVIAISKSWDKVNFTFGTFRNRVATNVSYAGAERFYNQKKLNHKLVAYKDDPNTSVAIVENVIGDPNTTEVADSFARSILVNGKSDGTTRGGDLKTTRLLAHIPALLRTATGGDVAVIGFGTGITIGSLTLYEDIKQIDTIEISPFVKKFSSYFDFANKNASKNEKVNWLQGDAYKILWRQDKNYDIIVSEPSNPWVTGVERLYAKEFYEIAKSKLNKGGIYAQWYHLYDSSIQTLGIVINNLVHSFEHTHLFITGTDIILLGSDSEIGHKALEYASERLKNEQIIEELSEISINSISELLEAEFPLANDFFEGYGSHTLSFPVLAFRAGKDFFMGRYVNLESVLNESYTTEQVRNAKANRLIKILEVALKKREL